MVGMPILQLYVSSGEPLNRIFDALRYEYTADIGGHGQIRILREGWRHMDVDVGDGAAAVAKCFTLRRLPYEIAWGWIATGIFPACHEVDIWIEPVRHQDALEGIRKRKELVYESSLRSKSAAAEYEKLERAETSMRQNHSGLFRCRVVCILVAPDLKGLRTAVFNLGGRFLGAGTTIKKNGDYKIEFMDHADYASIIEYVKKAGPKHVVTDSVRGGQGQRLAKAIRDMGIDAVARPSSV